MLWHRPQLSRARRLPFVLKSKPRAPSSAEAHRKGNQIALQNIRLRLQLAFGTKADLVTSQSEGVYTVTLKMPGAGRT